jgi:acyl-CoA dehydrogenase
VDFQPDEELELVRAGVRQVCQDFDDRYWRRCDAEHEFPHEFYEALARGG